jgi:putative tryptophan/tyrosine transport system substrate-binding protein
LSDVRAAGREIGQDLLIVNASAGADLDAALAIFVQRRIDRLIVGSDPMFARRADRLAALTARSAIPSIHDWRSMVSAGGLISYGTNFNDSFRQMGIYTGQILKGTKPADLPVVQPTKLSWSSTSRPRKRSA